jgi:hypothetical protein
MTAVIVGRHTPTQKPAAHCCGRVLGETIHFEQNTMVDRTGQPKCEFFIHRLFGLEKPCSTKAPPLDAAKPALTGEDARHCLEFSDDFFGGKLGIRLGRKIIRGHDARYRLALDEGAGLPMRGYGRAPMPRPALVGNNRKLR